jgi:hypothetical protein
MARTKIKDFIDALEAGKTREEARDIAECSDATSKIQFTKWNKSKGNTVTKEKKQPVVKSPLPGKPLPKAGK